MAQRCAAPPTTTPADTGPIDSTACKTFHSRPTSGGNSGCGLRLAAKRTWVTFVATGSTYTLHLSIDLAFFDTSAASVDNIDTSRGPVDRGAKYRQLVLNGTPHRHVAVTRRFFGVLSTIPGDLWMQSTGRIHQSIFIAFIDTFLETVFSPIFGAFTDFSIVFK